MARWQTSVLLVYLFTIIAILVQGADEKKTNDTEKKVEIKNCYQCSSSNEDEEWCKELDVDKHKPTACDTKDSLKPIGCRKLEEEIEGKKRFVRGCAYRGENEVGKKRTGNKDIRIFTWQCSDKDACNTAPIQRNYNAVLFATVLAPLLVAFLVRQ